MMACQAALEMDFQKQLLDAGRALGRDQVKALAFLCTDLLGRNPSSVESAGDLFSRLADQGLLSPEKPQLLTELLLIIQRPHLVQVLSLTDPAHTTRSLISPYRKLLYTLSEEITDVDLKDVKFLLNKMLPRRKLEENVTTLDVFLEMEHMDLISDTNLNKLETIFQSVCPVLNEKINQFKALRVPHTNYIAQEVGRLRSMTSPYEENQASQSLARTGSYEIPGFQQLTVSPMNSSSTSVVRSDALGMWSSQENKTFSEKQTSQTTNTEGLGTYPMTAAKRGVCLIVNNYDFSKSKLDLKKREGTMTDEKSLHNVFEWLGFEVQIHNDCNRNEMLSALRELGSRDHRQMDCLVCCVLSHGLEGSVYAADGHVVELDELTDPFDGLKCPSLAEKPKLFFIQACQGTNEQKAVYIEADSSAPSPVCPDAVRAKESIPSGADFLLGMATVPSFVSFRDRKNGTWFIQALCQNLVEMVPRRYDLVSILTKVNADVSQKTVYAGEKKQMPQPAFSLRKKVIFPVPKAPPPSLPQ